LVTARDAGEEYVLDVRDDQSQRVRGAGDHAAGQGVGVVAQFLGRSQHALTRHGVDPAEGAKSSRHRGLGHADALRDLFDGDRVSTFHGTPAHFSPHGLDESASLTLMLDQIDRQHLVTPGVEPHPNR